MKLNKIKEILPAFCKWYQDDEHRYKWKAAQQFSDGWDPVAPDFGAMMKRAVHDDFVGRFWKNRPKHFLQSISHMAEINRPDLQQAFQDLLYPRVEINSRISLFKEDLDRIFKPLYHRVGLGVKNHGHDDEVIWMYLALLNPSKYALYRYDVLHHYLKQVEARKVPGPSDWSDILQCHQILVKVLHTQTNFKELVEELGFSDGDRQSLLFSFDFMEYLSLNAQSIQRCHHWTSL